MLAERRRPAYIGTPTDGSRTITLRDVPTSEAAADDDDIAEFSSHPRPVLKLRGGPRSEQRVAWKEGVVDNENAGKRKSKSAYTLWCRLAPLKLMPQTVTVNEPGLLSLLHIP